MYPIWQAVIGKMVSGYSLKLPILLIINIINDNVKRGVSLAKRY